MKAYVFRLFILAMVLSLFSCGTPAPTGASFRPVTNIPEDKAVVYLYWKTRAGATFLITANDGEPITELQWDGYYPYITSPGTIEFATHITNRIYNPLVVPVVLGAALEPVHRTTLTVEAGNAYYVTIRGSTSLQLTEASAGEARNEISSCKLLPSYPSIKN